MARRDRKRIGATAGGWPGRGRIVSRGSKRPAELPNELTGYDARAAAALSLFKREELPVEVLDELHWRIMPAIAPIQPLALDRGYLFWRGYWRRPDGSHGGGGARKLIEEVRRASSGPGRNVRCDALTPQHYKVVTFFLATMPSRTR
jgi:hypothetical protein